jgi:putative sensor protein
MTTIAARPRRGEHTLGLLDPATYRRSLHLLLDLPLGIVAGTVAITLLSLSAGLLITLVGVPLVMATLLAARLFGRLERARARALLDVDLPQPAAPHGWRGWLTDAGSWRALGYAVALFPVGLVTGELTLIGWSAALAAIAFPAYAWTLADPVLHLGGIAIGGAPAMVASVVLGLLLLAAMPALTRALAACDAALIRALLR